VTESFYTIVFILKNQERCRTVNPNLKEMWGKIFATAEKNKLGKWTRTTNDSNIEPSSPWGKSFRP
jgi:hypothetical protein